MKEEFEQRMKVLVRKDRKKLKTLIRRANHLKDRIDGGDYGKFNYDKREMSSLDWAINKIVSLEEEAQIWRGQS